MKMVLGPALSPVGNRWAGPFPDGDSPEGSGLAEGDQGPMGALRRHQTYSGMSGGTFWRWRCISRAMKEELGGEKGIHGRGMVRTKAGNEGKSGTFEEQSERQQVMVGEENGDILSP